ncbi:hypothetical protein [Nostoc sp. 'Lobaria pulmonaria (5183) cyanobiont']|uniref:hypothetical protein n=1 Tax=Nostoc sp. 'Lobaria pulmonaria (5183) cyanobiont' TaxID=1618022 RepID=UPI000CF35A4E|nr:hypothetical protein [Nostoc sp. 'Lobaria pulmonaria (5183) cyanobiont']AVH73084.1 hypothetical protein NLP_4695 [Nostoc sp. 'Lobaria pulmonaria (5183) cyanobiont']
MKAKLLNFLTVCVVTLAVLSPELVVFGIVWERHLELVKSQNLACEVNNTTTDAPALAPYTEGTHSPQTNIQSSDRNVVHQMLTVAEQYKFATILQWFFLLTPICVGLGILFYDRYLVHRAAVLKEQVEMLERLWHQSIEQ